MNIVVPRCNHDQILDLSILFGRIGPSADAACCLSHFMMMNMTTIDSDKNKLLVSTLVTSLVQVHVL